MILSKTMSRDAESDTIVLLKTIQIPEIPETYIVKSRKGKEQHLFCRDGDFKVESGTTSKGCSYIVCTSPDEKVCPALGGVNGQVTGVEISGESQEELAAFVTCGYTSEAFTGDTAITDYRNIFGSDEDFPLVLSASCFQTTEECPDDPLTGQKMPLCSKFVSTTETGKICREESVLPENSDTIKSDMEAYCRANTTADCRCIDRTGTLIYDSLRTGSSADDGCWWRWCSKPKEFLVPPDIVRATSENVCVPVRKQIAQEINKNVETIECCQIQQNVIYAPDGVVEQKVNCFFRDAQRSQSTWFTEYGWWVLIIAIFIAFILAGLFVVMVYQRHQHIGAHSTLGDYYQS